MRTESEGIKETLESIIVALILAFVFRAFVVEAFVIPTGSMAPTLYGAHGTIICEECGTEFAYGLKDLSDSRRPTVGANHKAYCPNCGHENSQLKIHDAVPRGTRGNPESGDRILVLKWPYDLGLDVLGPNRWDVVVFKDPSDGETNYIKRMVGKPREVLMILDGDVYTAPLDTLSKDAVDELNRRLHVKYQHRTGQRRDGIRPASEKLLRELDGEFTIPRKTKAAQQVLWQPVYNHDFPPTTLDAYQPHWSSRFADGASEWDTSGRTLRFEDKADIDDHVDLIGKDADTCCRAYCAYNIDHHQRRDRRLPRAVDPPVGDQRISFVLTPEDGQASLAVRLAKRARSFWVVLSPDGAVALFDTPECPTQTDKPIARAAQKPLVPGRSIKVSFENVDYRVALLMDDQEVLATSSDRTDMAYYGPDVRSLRTEAFPPPGRAPRMHGLGGAFALSHVVVERDIYYHTRRDPLDYRHRYVLGGLSLDWGPKDGWGAPGYPMLLRDDEYFMLGDNTAASKDSRLWDQVCAQLALRNEAYQLGTVPRDQMVGRAFFVYWPSPQRVNWLTLRRGIVPDVGRMRFIR